MQQSFLIFDGIIFIKKHIRKNFGKLVEDLSIPNLIEVQKNSYNEFLNSKSINDQLSDLSKGIDKVFKSIFPIEDGNDKSTLEYISYKLEKPKFDVIECKQRSLSYSAALKANLRLVVYDIDAENNTKQILSAKEQEVFIGDLPLMTPSATFITNGVERVVVNQMHRSPGVFFDHDIGITHYSGKLLFNCRIIPSRGSWLDFEFDPKDILYFRIDRKKKLPISTFLFALGFSKEKIIDTFYSTNKFFYNNETKKWTTNFDPENYKRPLKLSYDLIDAKNNKKVLRSGEKLNILIANKLKENGLETIAIPHEQIIGRYVGKDIKDKNGEILIGAGFDITEEQLDKIISQGIKELSIVNIDPINKGPYILESLKIDKNINKSDALNDIYKVLRPGEAPSVEIAGEIFNNLYFNKERYDLSEVGRVKLNSKLNLSTNSKKTVLDSTDIVSIIKFMLDLGDGKGDVDDIDHLGNRRVRSVGELWKINLELVFCEWKELLKKKCQLF